MIALPQHGRVYKSEKEVLAAWDSGKDFLIADQSHPDNGRLINKANAGRFRSDIVTILYNKGKATINIPIG